MISFKEFIAEGNVIDRDYGLIHNPSHEQLHRMVTQEYGARMLYHKDHGLFAWPAETKIHSQVSDDLEKKHGYGEVNWDHLEASNDRENKNGVISYNKYGGPIDHPAMKKVYQGTDDEFEKRSRLWPIEDDE